MGRRKKFKIPYPSARVHHLTIWVKDKEGNVLMTSEQLKKCLEEHEGAWVSYAFILHDSDVYDAEDVYQYSEKNKKTYLERLKVLSDLKGLERDETSESGFVFDEELAQKAQQYADEQFPMIEKGQAKNPHWHVVLQFSVNRNVGEIANWFKLLNGKRLEPNWDEVKTGHTALANAWLYLVHKNAPRKYPYDKEDVFASFDYIHEFEEKIRLDEAHEKYHLDVDIFNDVIEEVMHGLPLKEAMNKVSHAKYMLREDLFKRARHWYIQNEAPMPFFRAVFYVDSEGIDNDHGKGGLGKSACAKAFVKMLAAEFGADTTKDVNDLQDYIFIAGDKDVFLQEYSGQPIVLIDEINGQDFKIACRGVNGVKALLAPHPERKSFNKKHGAVVCTAKYIVINGIESFEKFKKSLAESATINGTKQESEESVKEQFDRRFWGLIHLVTTSEVEYWINKGLFAKVPQEKNMLEMVSRFNVSYGAIASNYTGAAQARLEEKALRPMLNAVNQANEKYALESKISDPDEIPEDLYIGEIIEDDDAQEPVAVNDDCAHPFHVYNRMIDKGLLEINDMTDMARFTDLIQRAIDHKFRKRPFDDIVDREDLLVVYSALATIETMR